MRTKKNIVKRRQFCNIAKKAFAAKTKGKSSTFTKGNST